MIRFFNSLGRLLVFGAVVTASSMPVSVKACAACFGESGSPMSDGLSMGVLALFGIVVAVLGGFVAFFVYLAKRAAAMNREGTELARSGPESDDPYGLFHGLNLGK